MIEYVCTSCNNKIKEEELKNIWGVYYHVSTGTDKYNEYMCGPVEIKEVSNIDNTLNNS